MGLRSTRILASSGIMLALLAGVVRAADSVEVLHWWTSGSEAAALNALKTNLQKQGVTWKDMAVAGGSGVQAMTALRARVTSGDPPTAVQMLGFDIRDWAEMALSPISMTWPRSEDGTSHSVRSAGLCKV